MQIRGVLAALLALGAVPFGCNVATAKNSEEAACADACRHFESCVEGRQLAEDCTNDCEGLNYEEACRSVIAKSTCDEFRAGTLEQNEACFPLCGQNAQRCLPDDKIDRCLDGGHSIANCTWVCAEFNQTYVGTCGLTFQGLTSPIPVCWCTQ